MLTNHSSADPLDEPEAMAIGLVAAELETWVINTAKGISDFTTAEPCVSGSAVAINPAEMVALAPIGRSGRLMFSGVFEVVWIIEDDRMRNSASYILVGYVGSKLE